MKKFVALFLPVIMLATSTVTPALAQADNLTEKSVSQVQKNTIESNGQYQSVKDFATKKEKSVIAPMSYKTYNFGNSDHIYSPGKLKIEVFPGTNDGPKDNTNWIIVELFDVNDPGTHVAYRSVSAFNDSTVEFECYGYHYISVYNMNYSQSGKFNVVW
ncbi:hypothetical protein HP570_04770 [Brevibacillus sp. RS1.1]|uniref:hypothetical protein n=1 Tax=Brevibacillus sp. RS1.1 TaxID=2738982 RepID=UPI00156BB4A5|nr:hypothetical protein [Brevibacillus sp. RS1.1]NRR01543.1 hypothetical protein [Brevibacillus sp. RS1.1]